MDHAIDLAQKVTALNEPYRPGIVAQIGPWEGRDLRWRQ
jgi:hypothetical protein